jgi:hypothetical protein
MIAEQSEIADYKLYTLPEPVTVAARQTKQVAFLDQRGARFERLYAHVVNGSVRAAQPAVISYRLENTAAGGLGRPLPRGVVSVLAPGSDGRLALVGQARPGDVPVGSPVRLDVGRATDVTVSDSVGVDNSRVVVETTVANAGAEPAAIEITHPTGGQAFRVLEEDRPHVSRDGAPVWRLTAPANGRATLRYTVQVGQANKRLLD